MAGLVFTPKIDLEKIDQLRNKIADLKKQIENLSSTSARTPKGMNSLVSELNKTQRQLDKAILNSQNIEEGYKQKIFESQTAVNKLSSEIIKQKDIIRDTNEEVRMLAAQYARMSKYDSAGPGVLKNLNAAKSALAEQRYSLGALQSEQSKARLKTRELSNEYNLYSKNTSQVVNVNQGLAKGFALLGGTAALGSFIKQVKNVRAEMVTIENSFSVLLNSQEKAAGLVSEIKDLSVVAPISLTDLSKASQMMLGFGIETEKIIPTLKSLAAISQGDTGRFNSLSLAFSQMSSAGKLLGQDLNQMINAGFNPLQVISKQTGQSIQELRKEMGSTGISSDRVADAFRSATEEGGQFYGMLEKSAEGIRGEENKLKAAIQNTLNEIGKQSEGAIQGFYQTSRFLVENYETLGKVLLVIISTYGAYRAALLATVAVEKARMLSDNIRLITMLRKELGLLTAAQQAFNSAVVKNPYVLAAVAIGTVVSAMWAFADSASAAEKAQERFNKEQEKFTKQQEDRSRKIQELLSIIQNPNETGTAKILAYDQLSEYSKALTDAYGLEELKALDTTKATKALNEERDKINFDYVSKNVEEFTNKVNDLSMAINNINVENDPYNTQFDLYSKELQEAQKELENWQNQLNVLEKAREKAEEDSRPIELKIEMLQADKKQIEEELENTRRLIEEEEAKNPITYRVPVQLYADRDRLTNQLNEKNNSLASLQTTDQSTVRNRSYWEEEKKNAQDALYLLGSAEEGSKKWLEYRRTIEKADIEIARYSLPKGSDTKKQIDDRIKLIENLKRSISQEEEKAEFEIRQKAIDAMDDGIQKQIDHVGLNYDRLLSENRKRAEQYIQQQQKLEEEIWKLDNPNAEKQGQKFTPTTVDVNGLPENLREILEAFDNIANKYISDNTTNIMDSERQKWNDFFKEYGTYQQKLSAIEDEFKVKLSKVDPNSAEAAILKKNRDKALSALQSSTIKESQLWTRLFSDAEKHTTGYIQETIRQTQQLIDYIDGVEGVEMPTGFTEEQIEELKKNANDLKDIIEALENQIAALNKRNPFKRVIDGFKGMFDGAADAEEKFKSMMDVIGGMDEIGQLFDELGNNLNQLGDDAGKTFNDIGKVISSTTSMAATGASLGGGVGAAIGGGLGLITGIAGVLGNKSRDQFDAQSKSYQRLMDVMGDVISRQRDLLDSLAGPEAEKQVRESIKIVENQIKANKDLQTSFLDTKMKSGGNRYRKAVNDTLLNYMDEISRTLGIENHTQYGYLLSYLDGDQLKQLQEQIPKLFADLPDEYVAMLQEIIDYYDEIENLELKGLERQTAISYESLRDSLNDLIKHTDLAFDDIQKSFEDHMSNAILNLTKNSIMQNGLKKWYEDFARAMETDGKLTDSEADELQAEYERILKQGNEYYLNALKAAGIDPNTQNQSQESTRRGFESMSQDTANELNGRFTALQMAGEEIKSNTAGQFDILKFLNTKVSDLIDVNTNHYNIADETRSIIVQSYIELQEIRENTGAIVKPIKEMAKTIDKFDKQGMKVK